MVIYIYESAFLSAITFVIIIRRFYSGDRNIMYKQNMTSKEIK